MTSCDKSLRLRAMEPEDLELIYRIENDPDFWRHGSTTVPYSRYALRQYMESAQNDLFADGQVRLVIEVEGRAIGLADLTNFDALHRRAEVGLALLPEHQGHHHGAEIVSQLCAYARRTGLHQIYATIAVTNQTATHLFRQQGFTQTASLKDWLRISDSFVDAVVWQLLLD